MLNSLVFTIRQQLVDRKLEPTLIPTQGIFNIPHYVDMVWEQLAFDCAVSYAQQWKIKLAEVKNQIGRGDGMGIELLTFQ